MISVISRDHSEALAEALARRGGAVQGVAGQVVDIIATVRREGDAALRRFNREFDGHDALVLAPTDVRAAAAKCSANVRAALEFAADRIRSFHRETMPKGCDYRDSVGARLGVSYRPMASAGVYVPGGRAAYPSSVLMNGIPARVAGVGRLAVVTPTPGREMNPAVAAALEILEIEEVYCVGGAQAVAALAYGTDTVPAVDFIAGPGNSYVAAAKKAVFGDVGIDSLAGASEVTVVADSGADPVAVAWDLLAQAEHDPLAQAILMTDDDGLIAAVVGHIGKILTDLPRREIAGASWQNHGLILKLDRLADAPTLIDQIAPEHLILSVRDPEPIFAAVHHAGSVFLGDHSPEAVGDYLTGPNHVLPTAGSARFDSGLSAASFLKRITFQQLSPSALEALSTASILLAEQEGLHAHAGSIRARVPTRS